MDGELFIVVHGRAMPAGSKRGFVNKKTGGVIITDAAKGSRPWKAEVKDQAVQRMNGQPPIAGALRVELLFWVRRPKGHYGSGRNANVVKASAPRFPTVKPDLLKLARGIEDAMTGIVYGDDAQIVTEVLRKRYTGGAERVEITVSENASEL